MAIKLEEWLQNPHGLMSLGEMLEAAEYTVDRDTQFPGGSVGHFNCFGLGQWLWVLYMPQDPGFPIFWEIWAP
eukprot:1493812-Karenia_brevis.AAC.1